MGKIYGNSILMGGKKPSGSITLTQNQTYDVTNYASAVVNVPIPSFPETDITTHQGKLFYYDSTNKCYKNYYLCIAGRTVYLPNSRVTSSTSGNTPWYWFPMVNVYEYHHVHFERLTYEEYGHSCIYNSDFTKVCDFYGYYTTENYDFSLEKGVYFLLIDEYAFENVTFS